MHTTIDSAGRIVIPKALREQAGLLPGVPLQIDLVDGRIEIAPATVPTSIVDEDGVAVLVCADPGPVTVDMVRRVQEQVRGR